MLKPDLLQDQIQNPSRTANTVSAYKPKLHNDIWSVSFSGQNLNVCRTYDYSFISVDK